MSAQADLFARATDPETSKAAARSMRTGAAAHRDRIVKALEDLGPMNHWELDDCLCWEHPTAARRMKELVQSGRVIRTRRTSATGSGRQATIYDVVG